MKNVSESRKMSVTSTYFSIEALLGWGLLALPPPPDSPPLPSILHQPPGATQARILHFPSFSEDLEPASKICFHSATTEQFFFFFAIEGFVQFL